MKLLKELMKMPVLEERRVTKSGSSFVMTLPKEWIEEHGIKEGDKILVRANGHIEVRVRTEENLQLMNDEVMAIRNLSTNHITRSDDDREGETREALLSPTNTKTSDSK